MSLESIAIATIAAIAATIVFWSARYLPFTGRRSPPRWLIGWAVLLAGAVVSPSIEQIGAEAPVAWWPTFVATLVAGVGLVSALSFERARPCYPGWVYGGIVAFALLGFAGLALPWATTTPCALILLLAAVVAYLIWLGGVILVCSTKPPRPPDEPPTEVIAPPWYAWPGGQTTQALNPTEVITSAQMGLAGPCDWDVGVGGVAALILETGGTTATGLPQVTVRYNSVSPDEFASGAAKIRAQQGGTRQEQLRTVFKVTPRPVNTNGSLDAANQLRHPSAMGSATSRCEVNGKGERGSQQPVAKVEVIFDVLPPNIPWQDRRVFFIYGRGSAAGGGSVAQCVLRREVSGVIGYESAPGNPYFPPTGSRVHDTFMPWQNDGDADASDAQYPLPASNDPNFLFRIDSPAINPQAVVQGYHRVNLRDFVEWHNGGSWWRISDRAPWFTNLTADLPNCVNGAPMESGAGESTERAPNRKPVIAPIPQFRVAPGAAFTLTATATDADHDVLGTFRWTQTGGAAVVMPPSGASIALTAPAAVDQLRFTVEIVDETGSLPLRTPANSVSDPVTVVVDVR